MNAGDGSSPRALRCVVSGRVQGVWYRSATAEQAARLGLSGSARNRSDGTVEVLVRGNPEAVDELVEWLWHGPPLASVTGVELQRLDADDPRIPSGFTTG